MVVLDTMQYQEKMGAILEDTVFQKIGKNLTKRFEKKVAALISATEWNEEIQKLDLRVRHAYMAYLRSIRLDAL